RLFDFRRVPVAADVVGRDALVALGKVGGELGRPAGPGNAAFAVHNDAVQRDVLAGDQRGQAEDGRLRVAAGVGDQRGRGEFLAVEFRQAVDRLGGVGQVLVALAVPLGVDVGVTQAVVGAEVDDADAALQQGRQRTHADAVRQTAEGALHAA